MLKFSKNSIHHRINEYVYGEDYFTEYNWKTGTYDHRMIAICPYFWGTVLASFLFPIVAFGRVFAVPQMEKAYDYIDAHAPLEIVPNIVYQYIKAGLLAGFLFGVVCLIITYPEQSFAVGRVLAGAVLTILALTGSYYLAKDVYMRLPKREPKPKKQKEPNIVIEMIKARKHKICPFIEFK